MSLSQNGVASFLDRIAHLQRVRIVSTPVPHRAKGMIEYLIVGDQDDVQAEITRLMVDVEDAVGEGAFVGPWKIRTPGPDFGKYAAEGYTRIVDEIPGEVAL